MDSVIYKIPIQNRIITTLILKQDDFSMYKKKLILSAAILTLISFSALGCSSTKSSAPSDTKASSDTSSVSPAVSPTSAPSKTSSDAENKDKLTN